MFKLKSLIIVINIFILIFAIELFFIFILNFKTEVEMNTCKRIYNKEKDFSSYSPNCRSVIKHWEQSNFVTYETNSAGRRDLDPDNSDIKKIAFIGDSFTFGAMVPIEDNYNFYAFNNILKKPFNIHNYGTPAEQLHNIFNKLKTINYEDYEHIIYGLTPNDFFDLVDGKFNPKKISTSKIEASITGGYDTNLINIIKSYLVSSATSRFILHTLMSNDQIYLKTYLSRKPYSGYLLEILPPEWIESINYFDESLKTLDKNFKSKLKIFILPQRAEVVSSRLKSYNYSFINYLINICKENQIDCSFSDLNNLSKLKESHFPVDGHLSIQGNHEVAKSLSEWAKSWN